MDVTRGSDQSVAGLQTSSLSELHDMNEEREPVLKGIKSTFVGAVAFVWIIVGNLIVWGAVIAFLKACKAMVGGSE